MVRLVVTIRSGETREIEAPEGLSAQKAIQNSGIGELLALCGGCCSCGTCHVYVASDWASRLPAMSDSEDGLLECSDHRAANSRLACQLSLSAAIDGLAIRIAPED